MSTLAPKYLTVIFRNEAPLVCCNDNPSYRSVTIELTDEQRAKLSCRKTFMSGNTQYYEEISMCFIEDKEATP